jgi:hypothetical protein
MAFERQCFQVGFYGNVIVQRLDVSWETVGVIGFLGRC